MGGLAPLDAAGEVGRDHPRQQPLAAVGGVTCHRGECARRHRPPTRRRELGGERSQRRHDRPAVERGVAAIERRQGRLAELDVVDGVDVTEPGPDGTAEVDRLGGGDCADLNGHRTRT